MKKKKKRVKLKPIPPKSAGEDQAGEDQKETPSRWKTLFDSPDLIYLVWPVLFVITFGIGIYFDSTAEDRLVYQKLHDLQPLSDASATHVVFSDPIELNARQNLQITAIAPVDNSWAWVGGDLINEETGAVEEFELPVEYYYGVENNESWTEGGTRNELFVSSLPKGRYTLRLEFQWEHFSSPMSITVTATQHVARTLHLGLALLGISVIPLYVLLRRKGWLSSN